MTAIQPIHFWPITVSRFWEGRGARLGGGHDWWRQRRRRFDDGQRCDRLFRLHETKQRCLDPCQSLFEMPDAAGPDDRDNRQNDAQHDHD